MAAASVDPVFNSTGSYITSVRRPAHLNLRVEGVARELETYLVIALKNTEEAT